MKDSLLIGMALGLIVGAVLVKNNKEIEQLVDKGEKAVKETMNKMNQPSQKTTKK